MKRSTWARASLEERVPMRRVRSGAEEGAGEDGEGSDSVLIMR